MIHENSYGSFIISSYQICRPGVYENRRTANYAFRFSDETLQALQDSVNTRLDENERTITYEMLKEKSNQQKGTPTDGKS